MTTLFAPLLNRLRRMAATHTPDADAALLDRFARDRDEDAFADLVARHGLMVWGVCRRVLGEPHDAEDAFQATFLVLARRAGSIHRPAALAGWLYGVALRVARKARSAGFRRPLQPAMDSPEPPDRSRDPLAALTGRELLAALEEEVERLPEAYRLPVVLCALEGLSQEEAARRLGWTPGSVKGRLERGRARLHARLARRGLTLAAALAAAELSRGLAAAVPLALAGATIRAALAVAAGGGAATLGVSAEAIAMAEGVAAGLAGTKQKFLAALVLASLLGGAGLCVWYAVSGGQPADRLAEAEVAVPHPGGLAAVEQRAAPEPAPVPPLIALQPSLALPLVAQKPKLRRTIELPKEGDSAWSMTFSPDSKTLAVANFIGRAKLWDVASGKNLASLNHNGLVVSVAFSPDGKTLAVGGGGTPPFERDASRFPGILKLWDVASGKDITNLKYEGPLQAVLSVAFSPDGKTLASAGTDVKLWDVATGACTASLIGHAAAVRSVAFSPDGKTLASGSGATGRPSEVKLWDVTSGKNTATFETHTQDVTSVAFSPDGNTVAAGTDAHNEPGTKPPLRGLVKLWDVASRKHTATLEAEIGMVFSLAFSPDGKTLAAGNHTNTIKLWDVAAGKETATLKGPGGLNSVAYSPDGKTLASGSGDWSKPGAKIQFWDLVRARNLANLKEHTDAVYSVSFSRDGKTLASAGSGDIKLWDVQTGTETFALAGHTLDVNSVSFSPDGKTLASGSWDQTIKLWDLQRAEDAVTLKGHTYSVSSVTYSPDGKTLASSGGGDIKLWDAASGANIATLKGHADGVHTVAFSPDGKTLASASLALDDAIRLWDLNNECKNIAILKGHTGSVRSVVFSPDGKSLASCGADGTVRLWDVATNKNTATLKGHKSAVRCVTFSPDGKTLASGGDGEIKLWDAASGLTTTAFAGHKGWVNSVAFSPDGTRLASGSDDLAAPIRLWEVVALEKAAR